MLLHLTVVLLGDTLGNSPDGGAVISNIRPPARQVGKLSVSWRQPNNSVLSPLAETPDSQYSPLLSSEELKSVGVSEPTELIPILKLPSEYLTSLYLDVRPAIRTPVNISYPDAPDTKAERTVLTILINEEGSVDSVLVASQANSTVFEEIARQAFLLALFTPGIKKGVAVKSKITIEILSTAGNELNSK